MVKLIHTLWGQRPTPSGFAIEIQPQYCEEPGGHVLTHPGSVFEGTVRFYLSGPMTLRSLCLIFRASERVNYDAMGWGKIEKSDGRIFSLRATLAAAGTDLSAGSHVYPFTVEMPMVNYPPTFQHHMVANHIHLVARMDYYHDRRDSVFQTCDSNQYPVDFLPFLETNSAPKRNSTSNDNGATTTTTTLDHHFIKNEHGHLVLPTTRFNVQNTGFIPIELASVAAPPQQVRLQLKRHLTIIHGSNRRTEINVMSTCFLDTNNNKSNSTRSSSFPSTSFARVPLPSNCTPSVTFSERFQIVYQLTVSAKAKHGFIQTWKKLFEVPITLGTLPECTRVPDELVKYNDTCVASGPPGRWKPRFLKSTQHEEGLPAYDCICPPDYKIIATH